MLVVLFSQLAPGRCCSYTVSQGTGCLQLQHKQTCWCTSFPHRCGTEMWSLNVNRDQTPTGKWAWPLIPKLYWPWSTWTNMNLRVEQPLLQQPHLWMCKFSSLSKRWWSGVMKGTGLLMANRKQKSSSSQRVSHSHICECSYGIAPIAWQGHRERHTHVTIFSYIQPSL